MAVHNLCCSVFVYDGGIFYDGERDGSAVPGLLGRQCGVRVGSACDSFLNTVALQPHAWEETNRMESVKMQFDREYQCKEKLPERLADEYDLFSCLKYSKERQVYLLISLKTGEKRILKCAGEKRTELLRDEYRILKELNAEYFPKPFLFFEEEGKAYLLREYVEGRTLLEISEERELFAEREAAAVVEQVCEMISYLHMQKEPVIYRDLKPQNIIQKNNGKFCLIDMDTARIYKETEGNDTVCLGTRETASPEQYGFMQTDERTDIYGLGMLLLFLTTGRYRKDTEAFSKLSAPAKRVIRKCTEFNPSDRYPNVRALQKALRAVKRKGPEAGMRRLMRTVSFFAVFLLGIAVGAGMHFVLIKGTGEDTGVQEENGTVAFAHPLIEQAVRTSLGKQQGEAIAPEELLEVRSLIICTDRTFASWREYEDHCANYYFELNQWIPPRQAMPLEDLERIPNLTELVIEGQSIDALPDLSQFSLKKLSFSNNNLTEISGLAGQEALEVLSLQDNPLEDISDLKNLRNLISVNLSGTGVSDLTPLADAPIQNLFCESNGVENSSVIEKFTGLTCLRLSHADKETVEQISGMTSLRMLALTESEVDSFEPFAGMIYLKSLELAGCNGITSLNDAQQLSNLNYLGVSNTGITEIPESFRMAKLETIELSYNNITDFTPLLNCPKIKKIFADERFGQRAAEQLKESGIEIVLIP